MRCRDGAPKPWTPGRLALVLVGVMATLGGVALAAGGGVLVWAHATQRDATGFYATSTERFTTPTYALTSSVDLGRVPGERGWTVTHLVGTVRVRAAGPEGRPIFVGIAPQADVDQWLAGVPYERVRGADFGPGHSTSTAVAGARALAPPTAQSFWTASVSGPGPQTLLWPSAGGHWALVVANADGRAGVSADVSVGARTGVLLPVGLASGGFGLALVAGAAALLFLALRDQTGPDAAAAVGPAAAVPGAYPARLRGELDPAVGRWLWLVKWLLVIPHAIVLAFLWVAVAVLTVVAGVAILFTGRYPRPIFDFNVGVMRWTWRVSFYAISAFGTDRYPAFSLQPDPAYPADFTVEYPERLSRRLVLVKWWLLALPHYLVVALFAGGWGVGWRGGWRLAGSGGLIALMVLVAGVVLAVKGRYPQSIFDFVMGMNRWCYRVLAYAALLTDENPPFRFDGGGADPGDVPVEPPPPPAPATTGTLVGSTW